MPKLILLRHGQSEWNLVNRFTGWVDVDLTSQGESEARTAGQLLGNAGILPSYAFTSRLQRAIKTLNLCLGECSRLWIDVEKAWELNERHYGGLTGLNKAETAKRHGDDQVHIWRRSFDIPPPELSDDNDYNFKKDDRYKTVPNDAFPKTESLKSTLDRVVPYWQSTIWPRFTTHDSIVIAAHGNSLRALMMHLFDIAKDDIMNYEIPTGNPLVIELDDKFVPQNARYLDKERAKILP